MRSYFIGRTPAESWLRTAHWYQAMRRFMSVAAIDHVDVVASMDRLHDSLERNVVLMADVYSQSPTARHKLLARRLLDTWDEVLEMSGEAYPESLGVVREVMQIAKYGVPAIMTWCWTWGKRALIVWGVITVGPPLIKGLSGIASAIKDMGKSDIDRTRDALDAAREAAREKERQIEICRLENAGNPAAIAECIKAMNDTFEAILPGGECGLLDTPTGTALGGIIGLVGGIVAADAVFGWVE